METIFFLMILGVLVLPTESLRRELAADELLEYFTNPEPIGALLEVADLVCYSLLFTR